MQKQATIQELIVKILSTMKEGDIFEEEEMFQKCLKYAEDNGYQILTTEELN
jgi:hypothetical protein